MAFESATIHWIEGEYMTVNKLEKTIVNNIQKIEISRAKHGGEADIIFLAEPHCNEHCLFPISSVFVHRGEKFIRNVARSPCKTSKRRRRWIFSRKYYGFTPDEMPSILGNLFAVVMNVHDADVVQDYFMKFCVLECPITLHFYHLPRIGSNQSNLLGNFKDYVFQNVTMKQQMAHYTCRFLNGKEL